MHIANCRLCGRHEEVATVDNIGPICIICADVDNGTAEPRPVKLFQREHHWIDRLATARVWLERIKRFEMN